MSYYEKYPPKFVKETAIQVIQEFGIPGQIARELEERIMKALIYAYCEGRKDQSSDDHWRSWDFGS